MTRPSPHPRRDDHLHNILLEYIEACEAGIAPDRDLIIRQHPDLADDLHVFFEERDRLVGLAGPLPTDHVPGSSPASPLPAGHPGAAPLGEVGDFRLVRELGHGGMGTVYEAIQISLNRRVALKLLPFASALDPRQLQRFRNEAAAAANLRHENIVAVHAVGCERGVHYFAMEYVDGQSLAALLATRREPSVDRAAGSTVSLRNAATSTDVQPDSWFDWVARVGLQAASALAHAHETGVVHRDIKPANLLVDTRGHLWVTDFGLAQVGTGMGLTMTGEVVGTMRYASPEQLRGHTGVVDHRSDLYSLGATLYELLTLRPPFDGLDRHELYRRVETHTPPAPRSIVPSIPVALETIVLKALRKEPEERYATATELADDLRRYLERRPILAQPPQWGERLRGWTRRHPAASISGEIALGCLAVASLVITLLVNAERARTAEAHQRAEKALQAERMRSLEAESRLRLAHRAVDEMMLISEEELAYRPEFQLTLKRVLRSALEFYEEVLNERRDDPAAQAELRKTTDRVVQILADLEVLRSATHLHLLRVPAVLDDLVTTERQRVQLKELARDVGQQWFASFHDIGLVTAPVRTARAVEQARESDRRIHAILTTGQLRRLRQLGLQSEGVIAFRDQDVAAFIGLTPRQRQELRVLEDDAIFGWMRNSFAEKSPAPAPHQKWPVPVRKTSDEQFVRILTPDQVRRWRELTGPPLPGLPLLFPVHDTPATSPETPATTALPKSESAPSAARP